MVLAAGFGTRLRPITDRIAKPLLPVANVPLLRWNLALLQNAGVARVVVNAHHLAAQVEAASLALGRELGLDVVVSNEPAILGTGGGIRQAADLVGVGPGDELVAVNGDILFDVDVRAAVEARRTADAPALMVLLAYPEGSGYGAVVCDERERIFGVARADEALPPDRVRRHFTGVHVLTREALDLLPPGVVTDVNRTVYPALAARGTPALGQVATGYWNDVGTPARLLDANADVLEGRVPLGRFHPQCEPVSLAVNVTIGPHASVDAASALGRGALVGDGARVSRSVVLDGTRVAAGESLDRVIALEELRVAG